MIIENGKKRKETEIVEEATELKEHDTGEKKISIGVVASICLFIVTVTVSIILVTLTIRNSKSAPAAQEPQTPQQSVQNNDPPVQSQKTEQNQKPVAQERRTVETSPEFPSGDLNTNAFPAFSYTPEGYAEFYATIERIDLAAGIPDEVAQQVVEAFTCNMYVLNWNNPGHVLYVEGKEGDWWSVVDEAFDFSMYINRDKNVVMYKDDGVSPDEQYNILSVIYNHYNSSKHTVYCLGVHGNEALAYVSDTDEYFSIDPNTYEVLEVLSGEEVDSAAGAE